MDNRGNLLVASSRANQIELLSPEGRLLGYLPLDGKSSNMAFDEPKAWVDGVMDGVASACGVKAAK